MSLACCCHASVCSPCKGNPAKKHISGHGGADNSEIAVHQGLHEHPARPVQRHHVLSQDGGFPYQELHDTLSWCAFSLILHGICGLVVLELSLHPTKPLELATLRAGRVRQDPCGSFLPPRPRGKPAAAAAALRGPHRYPRQPQRPAVHHAGGQWCRHTQDAVASALQRAGGEALLHCLPLPTVW